MQLKESAGIALRALRANKMRSFLTLLGVIVGVSSVIAAMSLVEGLNHYVSSRLLSAGSNVFSIDKIGIVFDTQEEQDRRRRRDLTVEDAEALSRAGRNISAAVAERRAAGSLRRRGKSLLRVPVRGVQAGYLMVSDLPVARGRPIGDQDEQGRAMVCVVGSEVAENLFGAADPLGRDLRLGSHTLTVVGVGERKGSAFGASQDLYVLIPLATFLKVYGRNRSVEISVRSTSQETFQQAQDEARAIMRARRHLSPGAPDDFEIVTPEMYMTLWRNLSGAIFAVIIGVSAVSLVVGGIVIMNIMLVSVTERTREIGIRKALGATRRAILTQFLVEAMTLSGAGGVIGLLLGALFALLIGAVTPLPTYISPTAVGLGLATASLVGVFFGAYPAARAARQDPIEALRYE